MGYVAGYVAGYVMGYGTGYVTKKIPTYLTLQQSYLLPLLRW